MTSWVIIFWERAQRKFGGLLACFLLSSRAVPWCQAGLASCSSVLMGPQTARLVFQLPEEPHPSGVFTSLHFLVVTSGVPVKELGRISHVTALATLSAS